MGLLLLTVIISGLALHAWLFIEIQLQKLAFVKLDKIVNPMKHTFNKSKHLHLQYVIFLHEILINVFNIANISSIIIYTETIDISIKPCFFHIICSCLLKWFLSIMELVQFLNLLLQTCKFLYHWQTNQVHFFCS